MLNHNFRRLTDLFNYTNIKVSHIFHRSVDSEWRFNNYCHNFNRVYIVLDGSAALFNDEENITMLPNNIYIIPANHTYSCRCDRYMEKFFFHFTASIIPQNDLLSNVGRIVTVPINSDEIELLRKMLYSENIKSALFFQNYIRSLILQIIEPSTDKIERDISVYRKYEKLYKYIEDNLYADISVAEVCRHIGFSQTYIGQKFKADTGNTIKQYITSAIIEKIKYMLLVTTLSIGDISKEMRFESESYCSKFFKKHMGISPSEYRRVHHAVI